MRKVVIFTFALILALVSSTAVFAAGRLNFMLTNLTELDITDVYIAPSMYPEYSTENLLYTSIDPATRIYIGPNYYGDQSYWNITLTWSNGYSHTFYRARLTRYNSYVVWSNYAGIHMQQTYERAFARYGDRPPQHIYTGRGGNQVFLGTTEKVNVAGNYPRSNPLLARSDQNQAAQQPAQAAQQPAQAEQQPAQAAAPQADNTQVAANQTRSRTRDLVFEDEEEDDIPPVVADSTAANVTGDAIAVKATVELTRDGNVTTVLPSEPFRSGDKVKLRFTANLDGYVYWLAKGSSGQYQVLFPTAQTGSDNSIKRNVEYTVPFKGAWRFDDNKGTETIVCFLAKDRIASLEEAIKLADSGDKSSSSSIVASLLGGHETRRTTTRDLVFEEEDEGDVNTKTQITVEGDPFVATYELDHLL